MVRAHLKGVLAEVPKATGTLVGIAGTVTTVCAVAREIDPDDAAKVHGARLTLAEVQRVTDRLWALALAERRTLPGLQPKRADVIPCGAEILLAVMQALGVDATTVSDRGLRWGLLVDRCGKRA